MIGLDELEEIGEEQGGHVDGGESSDAVVGVGRQAAGEPAGGGAGCAGEVAVDGDFDEIGAGDVAERFEADGERGDGGLNPVGANVVAEAAHEARVVDLADRVFVFLLQLGFCGLVFLVGHAGSGVSALQIHCTVRRVIRFGSALVWSSSDVWTRRAASGRASGPFILIRLPGWRFRNQIVNGMAGSGYIGLQNPLLTATNLESPTRKIDESPGRRLQLPGPKTENRKNEKASRAYRPATQTRRRTGDEVRGTDGRSSQAQGGS